MNDECAFVSSILYTEGTEKLNQEVEKDLKKSDPEEEESQVFISQYVIAREGIYENSQGDD